MDELPENQTFEALRRAAEACGSWAGLARALKVDPQVINNWKTRGVPSKRVLDVEQATNGEVTRHELRPDLYPAEAAA